MQPLPGVLGASFCEYRLVCLNQLPSLQDGPGCYDWCSYVSNECRTTLIIFDHTLIVVGSNRYLFVLRCCFLQALAMNNRPDWLSYRARDGVLETHIASDGGARAFSLFVEKAMQWSEVPDIAQEGAYRFNLLDTFFSDSIPEDLLVQIFRKSTSRNPGRILIVDPNSPYAQARASSLGGATCKQRSRLGLIKLADAMQEAIRKRTTQNVPVLIDHSNLDIYQLANKVRDLGLSLNIKVHFYSFVPSGPLYFFRDILLCGRFSAGSSAIDLPWSMIVDDSSCKGDQFDMMLREYEYIWEAGYDSPYNSTQLTDPHSGQFNPSLSDSSEIKIFISHAEKNVSVARALVDCIEKCLEVPENSIRCTSLPGYTLSPGQITDEILRSNLEHCVVVIGLLTQESLKSIYVNMELGAAWGLKKTTCAMLAPNIPFSSLPTPLSRVHALRMDNADDILSLVETIREKAVLSSKRIEKLRPAIQDFVDSVKSAESKDI